MSAPQWLVHASDALLQPMGGRAWAVPPARPPRHAPRDEPTVALLGQAADFDLRIAVWFVIHASPRFGASEEVPTAAARWCLESGPIEREGFARAFDALDLASVVPRHRILYPSLVRQSRPLRATDRARTRWLARQPALAVAWDATVDHHAPVGGWSFADTRDAIRRLPRLVQWLRAQEPEADWTVTSAWREPVGRMLVERSELAWMDDEPPP